MKSHCLKRIFGPEKGLLGVEKKIKSEIEKERERERESTLVEDPYPGGNCLARRGLDPHSPFRTYTKFFLFSERVIESEEAGMREKRRVRKIYLLFL